MIERETIVVGGGPGGSSAAWELVRRGRDCLVLDRDAFPREKLCAGWITPEVLTDLEFTPADYPHRFLTFNALQVTAFGLHVALRSPQHSIRRFEFDDWLLQRSGVDVATHTVREIRSEADGFVIDDRYRCRYLVGAGGTRCPVYRTVYRDRQPRHPGLQAVALECEYRCDWQDADCHLWFLTDGLPGYSWYVPKADGYLNLGVGGMALKLKRGGDDIRRHWQRLVERFAAAGTDQRAAAGAARLQLLSASGPAGAERRARLPGR
jgi:flavin-dependent dehydrogenase